ncbi:hypothetical protein CSC67_08470 [Pusillimonas caeni]|uniref:hypothetical protein n=1 Tax=Pusillimonas caeni TaxID=1348472 RepID=UPI000E5A01FA|nr:hypothetical protein [Pusillimonas caeni]TFL14177.1 hypothetical protein CSC67_08470 [Pusillimonas caeni]
MTQLTTRLRAQPTSDIMREAADEIDRLTNALRVAVLALAHANQEHGAVYDPAYKIVSDALQEQL